MKHQIQPPESELHVPGEKHSDIYLQVYDVIKKSMYTDLTCCFPITSKSGNKYQMVVAELDGNYIDAEPKKSCLT